MRRGHHYNVNPSYHILHVLDLLYAKESFLLNQLYNLYPSNVLIKEIYDTHKLNFDCNCSIESFSEEMLTPLIPAPSQNLHFTTATNPSVSSREANTETLPSSHERHFYDLWDAREIFPDLKQLYKHYPPNTPIKLIYDMHKSNFNCTCSFDGFKLFLEKGVPSFRGRKFAPQTTQSQPHNDNNLQQSVTHQNKRKREENTETGSTDGNGTRDTEQSSSNTKKRQKRRLPQQSLNPNSNQAKNLFTQGVFSNPQPPFSREANRETLCPFCPDNYNRIQRRTMLISTLEKFPKASLYNPNYTTKIENERLHTFICNACGLSYSKHKFGKSFRGWTFAPKMTQSQLHDLQQSVNRQNKRKREENTETGSSDDNRTRNAENLSTQGVFSNPQPPQTDKPQANKKLTIQFLLN